MIYSIYPFKDATIYEKTESMNTGLDAVLELSHELGATGSANFNSRILMYFSTRVHSTRFSPNIRSQTDVTAIAMKIATILEPCLQLQTN